MKGFILRVSYTGFSYELDQTIRQYLEATEFESGFFMEEGADEGERELYFVVPTPWSFYKEDELADIGRQFSLVAKIVDIS